MAFPKTLKLEKHIEGLFTGILDLNTEINERQEKRDLLIAEAMKATRSATADEFRELFGRWCAGLR